MSPLLLPDGTLSSILLREMVVSGEEIGGERSGMKI